MFNIPILNILWQIVAGQRYKYDDPKLRALVDIANDITNIPFSRPDLETFFPFIQGTFLQPRLEQGLAQAITIKRFLEEEIREHRESFDPDNIRDFIDSYINEIKVDSLVRSGLNTSLV